jgi:hypothetical protein
MDYEGEWGGGGPGHSWALKWHEQATQVRSLAEANLVFVSRVIINIMHLVLPPPTPPQVHNVESHYLLEINSHL